jgi:hypothetical protein
VVVKEHCKGMRATLHGGLSGAGKARFALPDTLGSV